MNFKLPFNWFDIGILVVLFIGLQRGRKNGLSAETDRHVTVAGSCLRLRFRLWVVVGINHLVFVHFQHVLGKSHVLFCRRDDCVRTVCFLKKSAGGKLIGSDAFGNGEFYLGMVAGMIKFTCIIFAALALLNARYFSPAEIKAEMKYQNEVYGSDFFPSLYAVSDASVRKIFYRTVDQETTRLDADQTDCAREHSTRAQGIYRALIAWRVPACCGNWTPCPDFFLPPRLSKSAPPATSWTLSGALPCPLCLNEQGQTSLRSVRSTRKSPRASTSIHTSKSFHCFGCHKGGDVFSFVKEYENLTFPKP